MSKIYVLAKNGGIGKMSFGKTLQIIKLMTKMIIQMIWRRVYQTSSFLSYCQIFNKIHVNMKCIVNITYVSLSSMAFEKVCWNSIRRLLSNNLSRHFDLWRKFFSSYNYQLLRFLFRLRNMGFNSNRTGRWMIYHNPYHFGDDWFMGNSTFYDYYWHDGSLTIPGIIGAW